MVSNSCVWVAQVRLDSGITYQVHRSHHQIPLHPEGHLQLLASLTPSLKLSLSVPLLEYFLAGKRACHGFALFVDLLSKVACPM